MKPGIKGDMIRRWSLPDRIFFGHGACHILAGVFLRDPPLPDFHAERIVPDDGFYGNHIYVTDGKVAFDYHGYSLRQALLAHHITGWTRQSEPGWHCRVERVTFDLLNTPALNARKMRGPGQYHGDPVRRAEAFLTRRDHSDAYAKALRSLRTTAPVSSP